MSVLDSQANAAFRTTTDGSLLFFPWGVMGSGRVVEDDSISFGLKAALKRTWRVGLCLTLVVGPLTDWVTALFSMAVLLGLHAWWMARLVRALPVATQRLSMAHQRDALARAYGTGGLLGLGAGSFAIASAGAVLLASAPDQWLAATGLVVFGLSATAVLVTMWPLRRVSA